MPHFESYISNGEYYVGCTGQTIYVYNSDCREIAKFKDIKYAYTPLFSPAGDIFVVKSTDGRLAVYSLRELKLIKKFRYSKVESQHYGCCFSKDGKYFYNIEHHTDSTKTRLSVYDTSDFSCIKHLFENDDLICLSNIEYDNNEDCFFLLGFMRDEKTGVATHGFIAKLKDDKLADTVFFSNSKHMSLVLYKRAEMWGFYSNDPNCIKVLYKDAKNLEPETESIPLSAIWKSYSDKNMQ